MKVTVRKANTQNVGMSIHEALAKARKIAEGIEFFRVQAFKTGNEWPVASWAAMAGDAAEEVLKHSAWGADYTADELDLIKIIDDDSQKVVDTILVNG